MNVDGQLWRHVRFGEVVRNVSENVKEPLSAGLCRAIGLEHIDPESLTVRRWAPVDSGVNFVRRFRAGQVLFGKRRVYQRKAAVPSFDGVCSGDILVFEAIADQLSPALLPFIVHSEPFVRHALKTSAGSLSPRTKWEDLARYEFDLPPELEQRRMAELLWAIEDTVPKYSQLLQALDESQSALLEHAIAATDSIRLSALIDGGEISLVTGPFGTALRASEYVEAGVPVISPINMVGGQFNSKMGPYVGGSTAERLERYRLRSGDVVVARKRDVGRAVLVDKRTSGALVGSDCIAVRYINSNDATILPEYLYWMLKAPSIRGQILRRTTGTTVPGINESTLRSLRVPNASRAQQSELIGRLSHLKDSKINVDENSSNLRLIRGALLADSLVHIPNGAS